MNTHLATGINEATFNRNERIAKTAVAAQLVVMTDNYTQMSADLASQRADAGMTTAQQTEIDAAIATLDSNYKEQHVAMLVGLALGDAFYQSVGTTENDTTYQWANFTSPNVSYSVSAKLTWKEVTFNRTERVSSQVMWSQKDVLLNANTQQQADLQTQIDALQNSIDDPLTTAEEKTQLTTARDTLSQTKTEMAAKYVEKRGILLKGIAEGEAFYMSKVGSKDPSYQWTSVLDPNVSYSLNLNSHVPRGTETAPLADGTEISITRTERVSKDVISANDVLGKILEPTKNTDAQNAINEAGAMFYRS